MSDPTADPRGDLAARIANLSPEQRGILERRLLESRGPRRDGIPRRPDGAAAVLSFGQQRLWFLHELHPASSVYNIPEVLRLRGALDPDALAEALKEVVQRHEALRTAFVSRDGRAFQEVRDAALSVSVDDLTALAPAEREAEARRLARRDCETPFDLAAPPLIRARVVRLADRDHVLVLCLHHIVSDEWSMGVLLRELAALYRRRTGEAAAGLPSLPIHYADFAVWQRGAAAGEATSLDYWTKALAGSPAVASFPADRPRPVAASFRGAEHRRRAPRALLEALQTVSRREGTTLFMTLLAGFGALFARETGLEDIPVGTPIAGRTRIETESLIGFFVNTLVMRLDLSGDPLFTALLGRVKETALGAYAHQEVAFDRLVEVLRPERSLAHAPLFQTMFAVEEGGAADLEIPGVTAEPVDLQDETAKFDLSLTASFDDEGLDLAFEYATDLFDEATVARFADHYVALLGAAAADPSRPISRLPLMTEEERQRTLVDWNRTEAAYPRGTALHDLFAQQATRTPEAIAVEHDGATLSFAELARRSRLLARRLRGEGVGRGSYVGVCMPRSLDLVVALLGILESGAAYVPLDPGYPAERLAFMLADLDAKVLLSAASQSGPLPPFEGKTIFLDSEGETIFRGEAPASPAAETVPEDAAYVIYTSGSTGKPKGVAVPHGAIVNHMCWMQGRFPIRAGDAVIQKTPTSFDASVWEFWAPLLSGARLVMAGPEDHHDPEALARTIAEQRVTVLQVVPALLTLLISEEGFGRCGSLRRVFCGGQALSSDLAARFFAKSSAELVNLYGPTEATIDATYHVADRSETAATVPIGRPVSNTRVYVVDKFDQPVPIGVAGELLIAGDGLATGYVGRPDLTASRFPKNPFASDGSRIYRTGDRVRWRPDGALEFVGRADDQVKIRGFRIELGEVEVALASHPAVRQVAVVVREDAPGDRRLVAYFEAETTGPAPASVELQRHLRQRLPEHMVPASFREMERLPRLPNGKIDRAALPAPDSVRPNLERAFVAPRDPLEMRLSEIFESVVRVRPVGIQDDFFDLGGHSMLAVRLFWEIEKATGKRLALATLFRAPTVEQLAAILREKGWVAPWTSLVPIQAGGSRPPFYCVHAVGGSVLPYRALSKHLGTDQPFYGLQASGMEEGSTPLTRVEEMAEHYLGEIRNFQPSGPYFLGGHSAGGLVAFEMARRLEQAGERVAFLALFDTWAPGHGQLIPQAFARERLAETRARLRRFVGKIFGAGSLAYLREKLEIRMRVLLGRTSKLPPELERLRAAIGKAIEGYRPGPYGGVATLFRASQQPPEYALDRTLGWGELAQGGVDVHVVPGHHGDIILGEPQSIVLAGQLRECLERASAAPMPAVPVAAATPAREGRP